MKRLFLIIAVILLLAGCDRTPQGRFSDVSAAKVRQMMDDKESFIVYVGADSCDKCQQYREILIRLFDSNPMLIYYIDIDKQDEKEFTDLTYNYLYRCAELPSTYIIKDGKMVAMKEEIIELGDLKLWLLENGIIG